MANHLLSDRDLDLIFRAARTHNDWADTPVTEVQMRAIYDLMRMGPTSANASPARIVFVQSKAAREKLADCVSEGNRPKVLQAPVTAIIAMDTKFYDKLPQLFPHNPSARDWFTSSPALAKETAFRNSTLQGAYFIIAARALGLDTGPMSGFDQGAVDKAFFADQPGVRTNFIATLGYGDPASLYPRSPRPEFELFNRIV